MNVEDEMVIFDEVAVQAALGPLAPTQTEAVTTGGAPAPGERPVTILESPLAGGVVVGGVDVGPVSSATTSSSSSSASAMVSGQSMGFGQDVAQQSLFQTHGGFRFGTTLQTSALNDHDLQAAGALGGVDAGFSAPVDVAPTRVVPTVIFVEPVVPSGPPPIVPITYDHRVDGTAGASNVFSELYHGVWDENDQRYYFAQFPGQGFVLGMGNYDLYENDADGTVLDITAGVLPGGTYEIIGGDYGDYVLLRTDNNFVRTGAGADYFAIRGDKNTLYSGDGGDGIYLYGSENTLFAGGGADYIQVLGDRNIVHGEDGSDFFQVNGTGNVIYGGTGEKAIQVAGDGNTIHGGDGKDYIRIEGENNEVYGVSGDDTLYITGDNNAIHTGTGDVLVYLYGTNNVVTGDVGNGRYEINSAGNTIAAGSGEDTIYLYQDDNVVDAGAGDDQITIFGDGHTVRGGAGDDFINVFGQNNDLYGGAGADRFMISTPAAHNNTVHDFNAAEGDVLDLSSILSGYGGDLDDVLMFVLSGADVQVHVRDDPSKAFANLATIVGGVGGLSVDDLIAAGTLVVA